MSQSKKNKQAVALPVVVEDQAKLKRATDNFVVPKKTILEMAVYYLDHLMKVPAEADNELLSYICEFFFEGDGRKILQAMNPAAVSDKLGVDSDVIEDIYLNHLYSRVRSAAAMVQGLMASKVNVDPALAGKSLEQVVPFPGGVIVVMRNPDADMNAFDAYKELMISTAQDIAATPAPVLQNNGLPTRSAKLESEMTSIRNGVRSSSILDAVMRPDVVKLPLHGYSGQHPEDVRLADMLNAGLPIEVAQLKLRKDAEKRHWNQPVPQKVPTITSDKLMNACRDNPLLTQFFKQHPTQAYKTGLDSFNGQLTPRQILHIAGLTQNNIDEIASAIPDDMGIPDASLKELARNLLECARDRRPLQRGHILTIRQALFNGVAILRCGKTTQSLADEFERELQSPELTQLEQISQMSDEVRQMTGRLEF